MYYKTCNVNCCVFCHRLYCEYIGLYCYKIRKVKKTEKSPKCVVLCGMNFYVIPTQSFWSLWGIYSHKLSLALNKYNEIYSNGDYFMSNIEVKS